MFSSISGLSGSQPFNDYFAPDTTQRHPLGTTITAVDPFWGTGKFIYVKSNDTLLKGSLTMWDEAYLGVLLPNTASQQFPFGIAMAPMSTGKYGWLQLEGRAVYVTNATVAADAAVGVTAAGTLGAYSTLKGFNGVRNRIAATGTKTFTATTQTGSATLKTSGFDGAFLGMALSGTGIPASSLVAKLDADGKTIYMGSAIGTVDKLATAIGSITLTGTYTGYGSGIISSPSCMSAVA